jgi:hypothetical protein
VVSFHKLKLTNNIQDKHGFVSQVSVVYNWFKKIFKHKNFLSLSLRAF